MSDFGQNNQEGPKLFWPPTVSHVKLKVEGSNGTIVAMSDESYGIEILQGIGCFFLEHFLVL